MRQLFLSIFIFVYPLFSFGQSVITIADDTLTHPTVDVLEGLANEKPLLVAKIKVEGNKITKEKIILRELFFKQNDTIAPGALKEKLVRSRQNLLNCELFNFVKFNPVIKDNFLELEILVVERWYLWPIPLFEIADPNFNTWWLSKDFSRTFYGMYLQHENFRGLKESLRLKMQLGYAEQFAVQYTVPYINKKQTLGLGFTLSYSRNKEITYQTINNKRSLYRDFGKYVRSEFYSNLMFTVRNNIYNTHHLSVKYNQATVADTITRLSNDYFTKNQINTAFLMFSYEFIRNKTDYQAYPLSGYYFDMEAVKYGASLFNNEPSFSYFTSCYKKYWKLNPRWFYAISGKTKQTLIGLQPYYLQKGLGYEDHVRSYEYYVIDGQSWFITKNNIKLRLIEPQVQQVSLLKNNKISAVHYALYLNLFSDLGFVRDRYYSHLNPLANKWIWGYGAGLDYVTYYDKTLRLEYSINRQGQSGFFLHIKAPI